MGALLLILSAYGAYRAPAPPSLPPGPARTHAAAPAVGATRYAARIAYRYEWQQGFIGAGNDVEAPALMTVRDALARCDTLPRCRAITYAGEPNATSRVNVYFKLDGGVMGSSTWSSFVKRANMTPPAATIKVGGTSRLELLLRADYFTLQNLTRVGDDWSFSRPLDEKCLLPSCALAGDISMRLRATGGKGGPRGTADGTWTSFTSTGLGAPATPVELSDGGSGTAVLAAHDLTALVASSASAPLPLKIVRSYERSADGAALLLRFKLTATSDVEIGALGFALPESEGNPPAGLRSVVWNDPHVGGDHGWVEFVRVVDDEATLLVTPEPGTPLEAWRPMLEDLGSGDSYEWTVASKAYALEWEKSTQWPFINMSSSLIHTYPPFGVDPATPWPACDGKVGMPVSPGGSAPWLPPTSITLRAGESRTFGLRLALAQDGPRSHNAALIAAGEPTMHGVPGYVLPAGGGGTLIITPPRGVTALGAAFELVGDSTATLSPAPAPSTPGGAVVYSVRAAGHGRARLRVTYSDGTSSVAHYYVTPPFGTQVANLGAHLSQTAWLPRDYPDPFGRAASVMPWDRSACDGRPATAHPDHPRTGRLCGHVLDDARAYDVGLSDDAGGGNPLGLASKLRAAPTQAEASRVDEYIEYTLYGVKESAAHPRKSLQIREGEAGDVDGIRMTMYYYDTDLNNHTSGHFNYSYAEADKCHSPFGGPTWCMTENMANATYRGFNYPHQIASYWAMYHAARHTALRTRQHWSWYLYRAAKTALKLGRAGVGFMDGTVAREVLDDLTTEGAANATFSALAGTLRENMHARQRGWAATPYPYGSEFGFDTTGQEEVVVWNLYFGNTSAAKQTVDHVLSYMRSSGTWAYNGGSRSWGDIGNNGKYLATFGTGAQDRGLMHYRSGLNMIPLIEWYRQHPDDHFALEVAMGALTGQMANIDKDGAPSMMFHAVPHALEFDPHSGDYGLGFFGNALEGGAYYVKHESLGELCYLCHLYVHANDTRKIVPLDGYRIALFIEPLGLYVQSQCGAIASAALDVKAARLDLTFDASAGALCHVARLKLTKTARERPGVGFHVAGGRLVRGAYEVALGRDGATEAVVTWRPGTLRGS